MLQITTGFSQMLCGVNVLVGQNCFWQHIRLAVFIILLWQISLKWLSRCVSSFKITFRGHITLIGIYGEGENPSGCGLLQSSKQNGGFQVILWCRLLSWIYLNHNKTKSFDINVYIWVIMNWPGWLGQNNTVLSNSHTNRLLLQTWPYSNTRSSQRLI